MANTIGTAYIQIEPSTKGIGGSITSALTGEAESAGTKAGGALSKALGTAVSVGATAIAGATAAVGAFGKASVEAGQQFDSSMSQVAATMGFSVEELNKEGSETQKTFQQLRDFAQEMGSTTAFSASEAADALNYMALAGYDADTSMKMLPNVLNLAAAGGIDLASASDMVTDAQSALGLTLDETSVMVDQMAMASSKSNTSVAQLGEAFLTIGANAKNLSGGTQELSTALGILADNGIKGAEGGTHLRNIMLALNPTTDKACLAWEQLGVSAYDAQGNLRPLEDTFGDLNAAMDGMSQQEKTEIISRMFNKTDLASVNALLATSSERWTELGGAIEGSSSAAQNMAEVQLDNLSGDITLFQSALEGAKIAVSDELTPSLREFVQFGSSGLSELTEAFKTDGLSGAMDVLGDLLTEGLAMLLEKAPEMAEAGIELLESLGEGMMENIDLVIETVVEISTMILETLLEHAPDLLEAAIAIIVSLSDNLSEKIPDLIPTIVDTIITIVDTLIEHADELIEAALKIIEALAQGLVDSLPALMEKLPDIIVTIVETLTDHLPEIIEFAAELIVQLGVGLIEALPELIKRLPEIIVAIVEGIKECQDDVKKAGKDIVEGLWQGIKDNWDDLKKSVKSAGGELLESLKEKFRIGSPSKVFKDEIGQWIPAGIAVGIEGNTDVLEDSMNVMQDALSPEQFDVSSNYSMNYDTSSSDTSDTMNAIYTMLQTYMPYYATNDRLNNLNFNVNNREFARLVNGVS